MRSVRGAVSAAERRAGKAGRRKETRDKKTCRRAVRKRPRSKAPGRGFRAVEGKRPSANPGTRKPASCWAPGGTRAGARSGRPSALTSIARRADRVRERGRRRRSAKNAASGHGRALPRASRGERRARVCLKAGSPLDRVGAGSPHRRALSRARRGRARAYLLVFRVQGLVPVRHLAGHDLGLIERLAHDGQGLVDIDGPGAEARAAHPECLPCVPRPRDSARLPYARISPRRGRSRVQRRPARPPREPIRGGRAFPSPDDRAPRPGSPTRPSSVPRAITHEAQFSPKSGLARVANPKARHDRFGGNVRTRKRPSVASRRRHVRRRS